MAKPIEVSRRCAVTPSGTPIIANATHANGNEKRLLISVRLALRCTLETYALDDADFLFSRQVNFETIHDHDVIAERYGTVGELRAELEGDRAARHTELREWLAG